MLNSDCDCTSSSSLRNSSHRRTKSCGKTFGAFEPPLPPLIADIRPWGAGEMFYNAYDDAVMAPFF